MLFQIDEAKRYLANGPLPAYRVALMLLDNAAEVLLDRWIEQDLEDDLMEERLQQHAREAGIPDTRPGMADLYKRRFLTGKQKKQVARFFDEKICYVTEIKPKIPDSTGAVLKHLHRYRNAAHHSGRVRAETVQTSGLIALELCCQLIEALTPLSVGYSSSEDFSWLQDRFVLKPHDLWDQGKLANVLGLFRHGVTTGSMTLQDTLAINLEGRLETLAEELELISAEGQLAADYDAVLAASQKFVIKQHKKSPPYQSIPSALDKPLSMKDVKALESVPNRIRNSIEPFAAFEAYADADVELERIEFMVESLGAAIEAQIQLEIDRARGR